MTRNHAFWTAQVLLAIVFATVGVIKTTMPLADLFRMFPWTSSAPAIFVRVLGAAELAASLGLVLPMATGILPWLTGLTASSLTLVMILATGLHAARGEWSIVPVPLVVGVLTAFVALGRTRRATSGATEPC
jgi:type IV secretory pathway VirB2 component (pilin)